ncbi:MAG: ATP-binding cassette domain-containing protein, partial [Firmicutes bacterium]|nr:ATP-binding cassette domain-containing protein [Bacillota bacterium]
MTTGVGASDRGRGSTGSGSGVGSGSGSEPLLSLIDVTKEFRTRQGTVTAVDRVTFSMQRGRHLGVVGASGSGKSTVVKLVQKLLPATRGEIHFAGADMTKLSGRALRTWRRKLQSVSQNPYASLFPNKTIGQNIIEPLLVHNIGTGAERKRKAESLMAKVGVALDQFYAFPHEISGGQQQRI